MCSWYYMYVGQIAYIGYHFIASLRIESQQWSAIWSIIMSQLLQKQLYHDLHVIIQLLITQETTCGNEAL